MWAVEFMFGAAPVADGSLRSSLRLRIGIGEPGPSCCALLEALERVVLSKVFGEEGHREVDLTASRAPDEALLDQPIAVHGDAALVSSAIKARSGEGRAFLAA